MAEERREEDVLVPLPALPAVVARPLLPYRRVDGMRRRAEGEELQDHRLVVAVPVGFDELRLGLPPHADARRPRLRPAPLDARVELLGELPDLALVRVVAVEVLAAEEDAGEQQRGVDRRQLDLLEALAGLGNEEVVEEAAVAGRAARLRPLRRLPEETQRAQHALARLVAAHPAALDADRVGGEPEAGGGHGGEGLRRPAVGDEAGVRVGEVPEVAEGALLNVVEKGRVGGVEVDRGRRGGRGGGLGRRRPAVRRRAPEREGGGQC